MLDFDTWFWRLILMLTWRGGSECFIWDSREAMVKNLDDAWFWRSILMLNFDAWFLHLTLAPCLRLLMMLDFDALFWHFFLMLYFDALFWRSIVYFDALFWHSILTLDFDALFWRLILTLDFDGWLLMHLIFKLVFQTNERTDNANSRVASRLKTIRCEMH